LNEMTATLRSGGKKAQDGVLFAIAREGVCPSFARYAKAATSTQRTLPLEQIQFRRQETDAGGTHSPSILSRNVAVPKDQISVIFKKRGAEGANID